MNHADRQRLSQLLEYVAIEINHSNPDIYKPDHTEMARLIAEARAIVDGPTDIPNIIVKINGKLGSHDEIRDAVKAALADQAPSPKLDAFLREPIHEYRDPNDTGISGYIRHPLGWQKPRRRHRALSTRRIALTTLIAGMILLALTASRTPTPSPSHQPTPERAAKPAPTTAQMPYRPGHQPGTPGNGLGVAAP